VLDALPASPSRPRTRVSEPDIESGMPRDGELSPPAAGVSPPRSVLSACMALMVSGASTDGSESMMLSVLNVGGYWYWGSGRVVRPVGTSALVAVTARHAACEARTRPIYGCRSAQTLGS
jgi:hypothetical protein